MNQTQLDVIVQAAVGIAALAIMAVFVLEGELAAGDAVPIVAAVLAAFGFAEVGRRVPHSRE